MKKQDFKVLKTKDLYPFPDNPFHVAEDETLSELAEDVYKRQENHKTAMFHLYYEL